MKMFIKYAVTIGAAFIVSAGTLVHAGSGSETIVPEDGEYTPAQAAAIKAVTDAVATGNESAVKSAISQQVALFPEITGGIVAAALSVQNTSLLLQKVIVRSAVIAAPSERSSILMAINGNKALILTAKITLRALVNQTLKEQLEWKIHENYVKPPGLS